MNAPKLRPFRLWCDIDPHASADIRRAFYRTKADQRENRPDLPPIPGVFVACDIQSLGAEINRIAEDRLAFQIGESAAAHARKNRLRPWRDAVADVQFVVTELCRPGLVSTSGKYRHT